MTVNFSREKYKESRNLTASIYNRVNSVVRTYSCKIFLKIDYEAIWTNREIKYPDCEACQVYSVLKLFTGLAIAAFID